MTFEYALSSSIVLQSGSNIVQDLVSTIIPIILSIIGAIILLIIGWIIGAIIGGIISRVIQRIGLSQYVEGTPLESEGDVGDTIGQALGDLVKYIIFFLFVLLAIDSLNLPIPTEILSTITTAALLIIQAAIILIVGFILGRFVGDFISDILSGLGVDSYLEGTPLARITDMVGGTGNALGKIIEYLIYYFAIVQAVNALQFDILTQMLSGVTNYLPVLIGALIFLIIGIFVADLLGDIVTGVLEGTNASWAANPAGIVVQVVAYYYVITATLTRAGLEVDILRTLFNAAVTAFFGALAVGIALAIAIGFGWGSKDFIADNIDDWFGSAKDSASDMTEESDSDSDSDFESPSSSN